jgi:hypothetical protein
MYAVLFLVLALDLHDLDMTRNVRLAARGFAAVAGAAFACIAGLIGHADRPRHRQLEPGALLEVPPHPLELRCARRAASGLTSACRMVEMLSMGEVVLDLAPVAAAGES